MKRKSTQYILPILLSFISLVIFSLDFSSSLGIGLFVFFGTKFLLQIGDKIEIRDIMILLASLQWIIGPMLAFIFYPDDDFYYMAVDIDVYMGYVVPATYAFAIGLYLPFWRKKYDDFQFLQNIKSFYFKNKNIDIVFIIIGIVAELVVNSVPKSIRFIFFLLSGLRFVGLFFLYLSDRKRKLLYVVLFMVWLFAVSVRESTFHDFLLWLGFFAIIAAFIKKPSVRTKIIFLVGMIAAATVIQTVKYTFRQAVAGGDAGSNMSAFVNTVNDIGTDENYILSDANLSAMVTRINQGWIIARIMSWTPKHEPFANGETINEAIKAALMPRVLFPNKVVAGGRTYFTRFTGKLISDNTSMGLGLVGEAYVNYGKTGGAFFMLIIGLFYNFFYHKIFKIAIKHPSLIFFIPLIFLQVIKAETDFSVILNYLIKSSFLVYFIFFGFRRFLNIKI